MRAPQKLQHLLRDRPSSALVGRETTIWLDDARARDAIRVLTARDFMGKDEARLRLAPFAVGRLRQASMTERDAMPIEIRLMDFKPLTDERSTAGAAQG